MRAFFAVALFAILSSAISANVPRNSMILEKDSLSILVQREQFRMSVTANYQGKLIHSERINVYSNYYYEGSLKDFNADGYLDALVELPDEGSAYLYFRLNDKNASFIHGFCDGEHYMLDLEALGMNFQDIDTPRKYSFFQDGGNHYVEFYRLFSPGKRNHTFNVRFRYDKQNDCFVRITEMNDASKNLGTRNSRWWQFWQ